MGFSSNDRVFCPEKLPSPEGLLPNINRLRVDVGTHNNAKHALRRRDALNPLHKSAGSIMEMLPCCES